MKSDFAMLHFSICPEMAVTGCVVPRKVKESPPTAKQGDLGSHGRKIKWDFCMSSSCMWKKWASKEHVWELEDTVSVEAPPRRQLYSWQVLLFHLSSLAASIPTFRVPSPVNTCTSGTAILIFKSGITKNTEHHLPMMTSQVPVGQTFFWLLGGVSTGQVWPTRGAEGQLHHLLKCISVLSTHLSQHWSIFILHMGLLIHSFRHLWSVCKVSGSTENTNRRC